MNKIENRPYKSLNAVTVINLAKITEQEMHQMVNDINRNFNVLVNSAISKGPSGISPEIKFITLDSGTNIENMYSDVETKTKTENILPEWQGNLKEHNYQSIPVYTELFSDNIDDKDKYRGIITIDANTNKYIGDFSGWLYQNGFNNTNEPIYSIMDAFPKLYKQITTNGDVKYTWIINGFNTDIDAQGKRGTPGTNANIFASSYAPTSQSFPFQDNTLIGDILFAPDGGNNSDLWIWKYEVEESSGISLWTKMLSLSKYFPQNTSSGGTVLNQRIEPSEIITDFISLKTNINDITKDSGLLFNLPPTNNGNNILCKYLFSISEETIDNIPMQFLTLKLKRNSNINGEIIDFNFNPGLKFDDSINLLNVHLGDSKIDFAPFTAAQIKSLGNDIFGNEKLIHFPFEVTMKSNNNDRYLTINDSYLDGTNKIVSRERSFVRWKTLK